MGWDVKQMKCDDMGKERSRKKIKTEKKGKGWKIMESQRSEITGRERRNKEETKSVTTGTAREVVISTRGDRSNFSILPADQYT